MLREVYGLTLREAKEIVIVATATASGLGEHEARVADALERLLEDESPRSAAFPRDGLREGRPARGRSGPVPRFQKGWSEATSRNPQIEGCF